MSEQVTLGMRLTEARDATGLTVGQAARRAGIAKSSLTNWESDRAVPRPNKLQLLAGVLGVSMTWLMTGLDRYDTVSTAPSRLEKLEAKVERLSALQRELSELSDEIARELAVIKGIDDELEGLAA